jgi:DNA-binding transcriptional LysR family regulator
VLATRAAPGGTLRVTAPLPIARQVLSPVVRRRARCPKYRLR